MFLKDLKFEKDKITSEFQESEELENIKSGERLSVIFGKIQRWFNSISENVDKVGRFWKDENGKSKGEIFNDYSQNIASEVFSHAEGLYTKATATYSHAEGLETLASGNGSHAEGSSTISHGTDSHAEGYDTTAFGSYSHAEGLGTYANSECQHTSGKYNIIDHSEKYVYIIGNGTSNETRSNALTLDWNGNLWLSGDVTATDTDGQEVSFGTLNDELKQTENTVMNIVKNQNNLIQMNNTEHAQLREYIEQLEARIAALESKPEVEISEITEAEIDTVLETE